jgi:hypothetical protein
VGRGAFSPNPPSLVGDAAVGAGGRYQRCARHFPQGAEVSPSSGLAPLPGYGAGCGTPGCEGTPLLVGRSGGSLPHEVVGADQHDSISTADVALRIRGLENDHAYNEAVPDIIRIMESKCCWLENHQSVEFYDHTEQLCDEVVESFCTTKIKF